MLAIVASGVYALDQATKFVITTKLFEGERISFIGELLQLHYVKNSGAAFSLGEGMTWIFSIVAGAVAIFLIVFARRIRSAGWAVLFGMLLGGNLGNLTDRLFREPSFGQGHVIDFLQLWGFPAIFNIADVAIVSSMGLFIVLTLRGISLDGTRANGSVDHTDELAVEASESTAGGADLNDPAEIHPVASDAAPSDSSDSDAALSDSPTSDPASTDGTR